MLPSSAHAQTPAQPTAISLPAMPMGDALDYIAKASGTEIRYDPAMVARLRAKPVRNAANASAAVAAAIGKLPLDFKVDEQGTIVLEQIGDIVVRARRDEAETSVLVKQTSTSSRTGQSLREQARNAQVISAKLIADQQAQSLNESLASAVGVVVNNTNLQAGASYSIRGYDAGVLVNGLTAGAAPSIANIERIEVLKGPDAVLGGADNQGGVLNIVMKKPSADAFGSVRLETGSFGQKRGTLDVNHPVAWDGKLSARLILLGSDANRNFGGYRGDEDFLIAPSLRFKNARTDVVLSGSISRTITGLAPFAPFNPLTGTAFDLPVDTPLFSPDQYLRAKTRVITLDVTQQATDWMTLVFRGQLSDTTLDIHAYTPMALLDPSIGLMLLSNAENRQHSVSRGVDTYARFKFETWGIHHKMLAGFNYGRNKNDGFGASKEEVFPFVFLGQSEPIAPLTPVDSLAFDQSAVNKGVYFQEVAEYGKLHVNAGLRQNWYDVATNNYFRGSPTQRETAKALTPNFGLVFDIMKNVSLWGTYVKGFRPVFLTRFSDGAQLPNQVNWNKEAGVKIDLFNNRALLTVSYFDARQSIRIIGDQQHPGYGIARGGQKATGIDASISGQILPGWDLQAGYTGTSYKQLLEQGEAQPGLFGQPAKKVTLYTAYRRTIADRTNAGLGVGVYAQDGVRVMGYEDARTPSSVEVNANAFLSRGPLDLNVGVRNLLDRRNLDATAVNTYLPYKLPRTWRLTLGYKFL